MTKKIIYIFSKLAAIFIVAMAFLLIAQSADAAFTDAGSLGSNSDKTANQSSLAITTGAAAEVGNVIIVVVARDNHTTTDISDDANHVTSVTDNASTPNTYTLAHDYTNGQGSAQAGAWVGVYYTVVTTQLNSSGTITANFANTANADATAMFAREFTIGAGNSISVNSQDQVAVDGGDFGSTSLSSLASQEWLFFTGIAYESDADVTGITPTSGYAGMGVVSTNGAGEASNMGASGEFDIVTATSTTSNPAAVNDTTHDNVSVLVAFEEVATVDLQGTITGTDESTAYLCSTTGNLTVNLRVDGAGSYTDTCDADSGAWQITGIAATSGQTIYVYLDGGSVRGSTVLVTDGSDKTDVDIYTDRVVLRDDANGSITNTEISAGNTADADDLIAFTGSDLEVGAAYETHVYTSDTYAPGANIDTGTFHIDTSAVFTPSANTLDLIGTSGTLIDRDGTFTQGTSTVTVTSASGTPTLLTAATTFHILTINSSATVINDGAAITINNAASAALTVTSGVLNLSANPTGPGGSNGTLTVASGATLCLGGGASNTSATCDSVNSATTAVSMPTFQTYTLNSAGTVRFLSDAATTVSNTPTYGNLVFNPRFDTTSRTYTLGGAMTINGNFTIDPSESGASTPALTVDSAGTITVASGKTTTIQASDSATSSLDINPGISYNLSTGLLSVAAGGTLDGTSATSTISLTATSGTLFTRVGTFNAGSTIVTVTSASGTPTLNSGTVTFYTLTINASGVTVSTSADTITINNNLNVSAGTLTQSGAFTVAGTAAVAAGTTYNINNTLDVTGSLTTAGNGVIDTTAGTPTVTVQGTTIGGGTGAITFYALTKSGAGTTTFSGSGTNTINNNLSVSAGTFTQSDILTVTGDGSVSTGATYNINANLNVNGGALTTTGTGIINTTAGTPTVTMSGTGGLGGGSGAITFYNLSTTGSGTTTFTGSGTNTVNNDISVGTGTTLNINDSISVTGTLTNTTTGIIGTTAGTPIVTVQGTTIGGGSGAITFYALTKSGAGTTTFSGSGTNTINNNLSVSAGTFTLSNTLTVTGDGSVSAGATFNINADLNVNGGDLTTTGSGIINTTAGTPTVTMSGTGGLGGGVGAITIYNLDSNTGANLSIDSNITISNDLTNTTTGIITYSNTPVVTMTGTSNVIGGGSGAITFYSLTIDPSSAGTISLNSNATVDNTLIIASGDTLGGASTLLYPSSQAFPSGGLFTAGLRIDGTNGNRNITDRTNGYGGNVELYSNSGTTKTFTLGNGASETIDITGNLILNANGAGSIDLAGNTHNPDVNITGNLDSTNGGGTENITTGTGTWTVTGDVDLTDVGTFTATPENVFRMNGAGASLTSAGEAFHIFIASGGSPSTTDSMTVNGNFATAGTASFTHAVGNMDVNGTFSASDSATFVHGGAGDIDINIAGNFTLASGTTWTENVTSTSQVTFDGDLTYTDNTAGIQSIGNVVIGASPDTTILSSDYASNGLTVTSADFFYSCGWEVDIGNGGITIAGTFDATRTHGSCTSSDTDQTQINDLNLFDLQSGGVFVPDQSTIVFDDSSGTNAINTVGTGTFYNMQINGASNVMQLGDALDVDNDITITAGTLDLNGSNQLNVGGSWDNDANFEAGTGKVVFDASSGTHSIDALGVTTYEFYDIEFDDNTGSATWQLTATLDVDNDFTITDGTVDVNGSYGINVGNNWDNSTPGGTFTASTGTVTMDAQDAGNTLSGTMTGSSSFYDLIFNDSGTSGAWSFAGNSATVSRDFTITGGVVTAPSTTLIVGRNFTNSDGFTHNDGTVSFNTTTASTLSYTSNTTFYNLSISAAGKQVDFDADQQTAIADNGSLTIQGTNCSTGKIYLDSVTPTNQWDLNVSTIGTSINIDYVDVEDSNSTNAISADNATEVNNNNSGNWTINGGACGAIEVRIKGDTRGFNNVRIK